MGDKSLMKQYRERRFSLGGLAALILGFLSLAAGAVLVYRSARGFSGGEWVGAAGFTAFSASIIGVSVGLGSFRENCRSYILSKVGTIFCGLLAACWFLIFCLGLSQGVQ